MSDRKKVTLPTLFDKMAKDIPLTMITCYDYPMAYLVEQAGIDIVLVGDSLGMTILGYDSTLPVTMEDMIRHAAGRATRHAQRLAHRRHALHVLSILRRAGGAQRGAVHGRSGVRRRQAGRRAGDGLTRAGHRRGRHPGDGPSGADPAERIEPGRFSPARQVGGPGEEDRG